MTNDNRRPTGLPPTDLLQTVLQPEPGNHRETGARVPRERKDEQAHGDFSQDAAKNSKPPGGVGNSEPAGDVNDKTRHFDNRTTDPASSPDKARE